MSEILSNQLVLQHSIQRALDNFKRLGKGNLTAAKICSRIATLKDNWRPYRENHGILLQAIPASTQASTEYFAKGHFDKTEEAYNLGLDYMTECLKELEPVVSHNQSIESTHFTTSSDASALSILNLPTIRLPPFDILIKLDPPPSQIKFALSQKFSAIQVLIQYPSPNFGAQIVQQEFFLKKGGCNLMASWTPPYQKINIAWSYKKNNYTENLVLIWCSKIAHNFSLECHY